MVDPKKSFWNDVLDVVEKDNEVDQEHVSLDEMYDEETKDNHYVEGIDNWEDWN
jgi:hypothetical protein